MEKVRYRDLVCGEAATTLRVERGRDETKLRNETAGETEKAIDEPTRNRALGFVKFRVV
jgi:hypothetical protein